MRLFLAIFPDQELRNYFRDLRQQFHKIKRTMKFLPIDQTHMTVKFLGNDVSEATYNEYISGLKPYLEGLKKFEYRTKRIDFGFQSQLLPTTLMVQLEDSDELYDLTKLVNNVAKKMSGNDIVMKQEHAKLIHHFTLARIRSNSSRSAAKDVKTVLEGIDFQPGKYVANSLSVVQSTLTTTGPIYKVLHEFRFK